MLELKIACHHKSVYLHVQCPQTELIISCSQPLCQALAQTMSRFSDLTVISPGRYHIPAFRTVSVFDYAGSR